MKIRTFALAALLSASALGYSMSANADQSSTGTAASGAGISAQSSVGRNDSPSNTPNTVRANGSTSEGSFDDASTPKSDALTTSDSSSSDSVPLNNSREVSNEDVPNANTTGQSYVNPNPDATANVSGNADAQGRMGESDTLTTQDSSSSDTLDATGTRANTSSITTSQSEPSNTIGATATTTVYDMQTGQIRSIQSSLRAQGFKVGGVDGIWGPRTSAAVRDFQQQNNLPVTGELDSTTVTAISQ